MEEGAMKAPWRPLPLTFQSCSDLISGVCLHLGIATFGQIFSDSKGYLPTQTPSGTSQTALPTWEEIHNYELCGHQQVTMNEYEVKPRLCQLAVSQNFNFSSTGMRTLYRSSQIYTTTIFSEHQAKQYLLSAKKTEEEIKQILEVANNIPELLRVCCGNPWETFGDCVNEFVHSELLFLVVMSFVELTRYLLRRPEHYFLSERFHRIQWTNTSGDKELLVAIYSQNPTIQACVSNAQSLRVQGSLALDHLSPSQVIRNLALIQSIDFVQSWVILLHNSHAVSDSGMPSVDTTTGPICHQSPLRLRKILIKLELVSWRGEEDAMELLRMIVESWVTMRGFAHSLWEELQITNTGFWICSYWELHTISADCIYI